jgi:Mrp family chromosome partitioning ATPase
VVHSLRAQRATISAQVAELAGRYRDNYPALRDARQQLRDVDLQIQTEIFRLISNLDAQSRVSQQRLGSLTDSLGGARGALAQNNSAMVQLDDLTRSATTSQALYESYLDRYKAVTAQTGTETADSRLLTEARIPLRPSRPIVMLNLVLGLLIGIGLGFAVAVGTELFFTGFTTGEEIEGRLGLRYLGGVPALETIEPREETPIRTVEQFPRSGFAESFRSILASVRHGSGSRHGVIAVTSALPGEGKTTLAICLGAANGISVDRVIVIDCDIARHRLSDQFVTDADRPGLREVLREGTPIEDALIRVGETNLYVLPITTAFMANEQITRGGLVHALVAKLREFFPLVILDCPPLLPVAEARDLVAIADDVMLVASWRRTRESALRSAIRMLPDLVQGATGVVLTRIDMKKQARFGAGDPSSFYHDYKEYYAS